MLRRVGQLGRWSVVLALALIVVVRGGPCFAETDAEMAQRYLRAAERDDVTAQAYVGALYSAGVGLARSDHEAFRWFLSAAKKGHSQAQVIVAELYALGKGVSKSNTDAYRWASQASKVGDSNVRGSAKQLMDILASRMSDSERASATAKPAASTISVPPVTSGDAVSYYRRGRVLAQRGDFAKAAEDFRRVTELLPNNPDALNDLCWTRAVLGRLQSAISACDQSLRIRPNFADALDSRGLAYLKLGDFNRAIDDFTAALRSKPSLASALYGRGLAKKRNGQTASGNRDISTARGLDPDITATFSQYGVN
jgi:tetratricopeptide (TPR) repeat protein